MERRFILCIGMVEVLLLLVLVLQMKSCKNYEPLLASLECATPTAVQD